MRKSLLISLVLSSLLLSNEHSLDDLFNLSLEELMNIEVVTATGEKETTSESISIISVITATQLKQMGVLNLYEAISFLPGVQVNETYMGYTVITFRGVTPGLFNNKALFMLNGHPLHEKVFGSSHLEFIPLEMVERIEVVRSPASVLYGTNAISGVINIITKQGEDVNSEIVARGGSNNHLYGSLSIHEAHISMSVSYQNDDGYTYGGTVDELGNEINKDYQNDIGSIFLDIYFDDWRINAAYYNSKKEKLGLNPIIQNGGLNHYESYYLDVNKKFKIGTGSLKVWLRYDNVDRVLDAQNFPNPITGDPLKVENSVDRTSAEFRYSDVINDDLNYLVGLNYEHDHTGPMLFINQIDGSIEPFSPLTKSYKTNIYALYGQVKYRINNNLTSIVGARIEENSDTGTAFAPRVGFNYEYATGTYLKFLYSQAYRSPVFVEKYTDVPGILHGDPNLDREEIQTFEISLDSKLNKKSSLEVTVYYLKVDNEITRRLIPSGATYNADGYYMYGLEMVYNIMLSKKSELMVNGSYTDGKYEGDGSIKYIANYTANMIFTYHIDTKWSSTLSNQFISSKEYILNSGYRGHVDGYNLSNITLTYKNHPFESNLYVKNIFDEEYTYPEQVRHEISELPGGAGLSAYLTLRYYF